MLKNLVYLDWYTNMRGSRNFCQGGGPGPTDIKKLWQSFYFFILQKSNGYFQRKL